MNTPFLHFPSLELETHKEPDNNPAVFTSESPFLAAPQLNGHKLASDPKTEHLVQIMDELYDEEFEDAIDDLLNEANDLIEGRVESENYFNNEYQSRHLLQEYYMPLNREAEVFFNQLIRQGEQVDHREKDLGELETFLEKYTAEGNQLTEIQEHLLGGLKKLAGKALNVVKKGVSTVGKLASRFGYKFLFGKIKKVVFSFLKGLLTKGLNNLPEPYRTMARGLAGKILPQKITSLASAVSTPAAAQANNLPAEDLAETIQEEINSAVAYLLTADNEQDWARIERELEAMDLSLTVQQAPSTDNAKQEFIRQLSELEDTAATQTPVEQFVPAVMAGVKLVLPIVGRQRVMNWFTSLIAKLIEKFVGKENSRALSKQMVDTGFRMLNLESAPEESAQVGASAVAETVEDTVRQLEHFPGYVFEDRQLFERYVVDAFEQAAAANMPDILNESIYHQFPRLRESNRHRLLWKLDRQDRRSNHPGFARIKRLNEVMETELTPFIANEVRTFGGIPLSTFLRDRMGITVNTTIPALVHPFEALPGSNMHHLAKSLLGMENYNWATKTQFHPLTSIAAGLLLGEPGLGCRNVKKCLSKHRNAGGHRYYYLELPDARTQFFVPPSGRPVVRGITNLQVKLDFLANEIRLYLYLSEADAQAVATSIRKNQPETAHLLAMMALEDGLKSVFSYGQYGYMKVVHPQVIPGKRSGLALELVPPVVVNSFKMALKTWSGQPLISYLRNHGDQFVQAAEDYADGVTLQAVIISPTDFIVLRQMIAGAGISLPEALFSKAPANVLFSASPGQKHA